MEKINNLLVKDETFYKQKKKSVDELMEQSSVRILLNKYGLNRTFVEDNWIDFLNFVEDERYCLNCQGIEHCPKNFPGYQRVLDISENRPVSSLNACRYGAKIEEQRNIYSHITCNVPKEMFLTSFKELTYTGNLITLVRRLTEDAKKMPQKGLYLYGDMGIGKTYTMAAFCNMLAINQKNCAFISMPQLLQDLKSYFNSDEDNGLDYLMNVHYLILDDLGAETLNTWGRDEVLYNLLNSRMLRNLPTYFTSFYDLKDLEAHYTINKSRDEAVKVKRLMERIRALSTGFELNGRSFR